VVHDMGNCRFLGMGGDPLSHPTPFTPGEYIFWLANLAGSFGDAQDGIGRLSGSVPGNTAAIKVPRNVGLNDVTPFFALIKCVTGHNFLQSTK